MCKTKNQAKQSGNNLQKIGNYPKLAIREIIQEFTDNVKKIYECKLYDINTGLDINNCVYYLVEDRICWILIGWRKDGEEPKPYIDGNTEMEETFIIFKRMLGKDVGEIYNHLKSNSNLRFNSEKEAEAYIDDNLSEQYTIWNLPIIYVDLPSYEPYLLFQDGWGILETLHLNDGLVFERC